MLIVCVAPLALAQATSPTGTFDGPINDDRADDGRSKDGRANDGPAELPRVYLNSSLASTPVVGRVIEVKESDNLQSAIDNAKCGDTLKLQAGATFRGVFRLPAKPCDDSHWILLRTSAQDDSLPPEGTRISPCYAGVASLPGRPQFRCASLRNAMAKIEFDGSGESGPILILSGANHYRLFGLEITRSKPEMHMRNLIQLKELEGTANHLVFDRLWLHGTAQDETKAGIHLSGTTQVSIVDSYFSDFHCISRSGSCTDAQAINGGTGDQPGGPYKIVNNFLEASGQSILFGGAAGSTTPADIEIRHNYLFKPMTWKPGSPVFVGSGAGDPFIVKNHFELKNAQRVLFEGNVLANCWGGFTQTGFSILLTPVSQSGNCPSCRVTDVTIRYSKISHVASGISIATALPNPKAVSSGGSHFSIHDLVFDDMDGEAYKGFGNFVSIVSNDPPVRDVKIEHITAFPTGAALTVVNRKEKLKNFTFTNNLLAAGKRGIVGAGGGPENCARANDDPLAVLNHCFSDTIFSHNLIIGGQGAWPKDNIMTKTVGDAGLIDSTDSKAGNYRLCGNKDSEGCEGRSPGKSSGKDGRDVGADTDAIEKATMGVSNGEGGP